MKMEQISSSFVSDLTAYNSHIQFYGHDKWKAIVSDEIKSFQQDLFKAIKNGYDGKSNVDQKQWSFSGSFLYSLTVISTIGKFVFVLKHKKKDDKIVYNFAQVTATFVHVQSTAK